MEFGEEIPDGISLLALGLDLPPGDFLGFLRLLPEEKEIFWFSKFSKMLA